MRFMLWGVVAIAACGNDRQIGSDAHPIDAVHVDTPVDADPNNPLTLFDTGLCVDRACTQISADVTPYTPQFKLWSDTASKRRWFQLPPGTQIDTTDMDHWAFPVGTKFWKEFTRDDGMGNEVRVETRLIMRIGADDTPQSWFYMPYQWNATNDDTTAQPNGVMNADGTQHDIPSRVQCRSCHEDLQPSRILGFQAIQLDVTPATGEPRARSTSIAAHTLTTNPASATAPYFPSAPRDGDRTGGTRLSPSTRTVAHCHNPSSVLFQRGHHHGSATHRRDYRGSTATTPAYTTAVGTTGDVARRQPADDVTDAR